MTGFKFKHLIELEVLTNLNHLVRGLQASGITGFKFKHLKELEVLTNPNHLVRGLQA